MYLRILLTTTLSLAITVSAFCQNSFPFTLETDNHSSYYGLVAGINLQSNQDELTPINNFDFVDATQLDNNDYDGFAYYDEEETIDQQNILSNSATTILEKKKDSNGNIIEQKITTSNSHTEQQMATVKVVYSNVSYSCNNLELTLGFETYNMSDTELNLSLPKGRYYYKIKGDLACGSTDGCQIDNTGIIDIDENGTLYLSWQVTEYQSCWMSLRTSDYYSKVID